MQANLLAAAAHRDAVGRVFNVASGERYTLLDLISVLNEILDTDIDPVHTTPRPGDVRHSLADISTAQEALGYRPEVDFRQGLRRTVDWYRIHLWPRPAPDGAVVQRALNRQEQ